MSLTKNANLEVLNQNKLVMSIREALELLFESEAFQMAAKDQEKAKLRIYKGRFKKGKLNEVAGLNLLKEFGFTVTIKKPRKIKNKSNK